MLPRHTFSNHLAAQIGKVNQRLLDLKPIEKPTQKQQSSGEIRALAAGMVMADNKPQRRKCCTATYTATPTNNSEKDDTQRTENGRFKHKMNEGEHQRTSHAESPLRYLYDHVIMCSYIIN